MRPLTSDSVILAFGDSLTRGTGASEGEDYPSVLEGLSGLRVINAGIPGEQSAAGLRRLPGVLDEYRPDLVVLCHGGNDFLANLGEETVAANLDAMVEILRARNIDVVILGVPKRGIVLRSPPLYADLAKRHGLPFDDRIIPRILSNSNLKSDYIHPNARGYAMLAEAVRELIDDSQ